MKNVPFYEEVVAFVEALNAELGKRGLGYGIAAEHAHRFVPPPTTYWCDKLLICRQLLRPDCLEPLLPQREMAHAH